MTKPRLKALRLELLESRDVPAPLDPMSQPRFVNALTIPAIAQPVTPGGSSYEMPITQAIQDLGLINPSNGQPLLTTIWGYNGTYPGPTFIAQRNQPIDVLWNNQLRSGAVPLPHLFPDDLMEPMPPSGVTLVTHLHGGNTASSSDGLPMAWSTPNFAETGPDFRRQIYHYENNQESATLWYHDHAMGVTRLNVYAGLAGAYLIREPYEASLNLPTGDYEIPLLIQDREFSDDGSLDYPQMSFSSGAVGDFMLVNGKAWPALEVEPRKYRFRLINGADSRFLNMLLTPIGGGTAPVFTQIGSDQGFLAQSRTANTLLLASGERMDVIVDFSDPSLAGRTIVLENNAPTPFPNGLPANPATVGQIMAFKVVRPLTGTDTSQTPTTLRPLPTPETAVRTRQLLLSIGQHMGQSGAWLGTVAEGRMMYEHAATETPGLNDTEIWEIYNSTSGSHPVHLHEAPMLVLNRQAFTATTNPLTGALTNIQFSGPELPPRIDTVGGKDTLIVDPGEVLRFVVKFDQPGEFVWHCHMLAHEDMEMMRPIVIQPKVTIADVNIIEGNSGTSQATFTISLNGAADQDVTLNYSTIAGTATALSDFQPANGSVTIPEGATSATVSVTVIGDTVVEPDETFFVNLTGGNGLVAIIDAQGRGTILNDDGVAPAVSGTAINAGQSQRSRVTSLAVTFDATVTFAGPVASAFTITRNGTGSVGFSASANVVGGVTVVTLTAFSGAETDSASLRDGRYTLTVIANQVSAGGVNMASNFVFGDAQGLFRFYGDMNGDRRVDIADFGFFSLAYLTPANYNPALDFNNDGRIDIADFGQFSVRYFTGLP